MPPGGAFYAVRAGEYQVGFASISVDTLPAGLRVGERLRIDLPPRVGGGTPRRIALLSETLFSRTLHLRTWRSKLTDGTVTSETSGETEGDSALVVLLTGAGTPETLRLATPRPVLPALAFPFRLVYQRQLRRGASFTAPLLDLSDLTRHETRVSVSGDSVFVVPDSSVFDSAAGRWIIARLDTLKAWRMETMERGLPMTRWVDAQGLVVQATTPLGLTFERTAFEIANLNYLRHKTVSGWPGSIIFADPARGPAQGQGATEPLMVRLETVGVPGPLNGAALNGDGQSIVGDLLTVGAGDSAGPTPPPETLAGDPLVQSDDPAIQRQSAEIVGSAREPAAKADRLAAWVAHRIGPLAPGLALSSAAQTLRLKRGDLTARGHLFMALARSAGLPVRRVAGARIVGESFYNEGWVEVYLGWWTPVDLTQGRIGGPAARVRLARDAGRWTEFVPLFGSVGLRLEPRTIIP